VIKSILQDVSSEKIGSVLLLSGDSGTGKTALAEWCLGTAGSDQFAYQTARATCEPFHAGMSMFPILELMRRLCATNQSEIELVARGFGASSKEKIAAVKAFDSEVEPGFRRENIMATFSNVVMAAYKSRGRPVAIFVDDLERIDTASVDALTILISRIEEAPILLVGAYRSDLVAADRKHNLKPVVERCRHGEKRSTILEVRPLEQQFTLPMVEDYFQKSVEASEHFLRRLYRETEGNPLYIREVLRGLQDHSAPHEEPLLKTDDNGMLSMSSATEFWEIPQSIEDAIATRLSPLSAAESDVLETASIIGRRFRYETLRATCALADDVLEDAIERLVDLDLVREVPRSDDEFEFRHGKVREVVSGRMTGLRKTRLHAKVAEVITSQKDLFSSEEWEIAMGTHLLLARNYEDAVPHLMNAGTTSLSFLSGTEATEYFTHCLEALEKSKIVDIGKMAEVRLLIGESLKLAGQLDGAIRELEIVAKSDTSSPAQRWALNHLGDICRMRDQIPEALDYYARSESKAKESHDVELEAEVSADLAELHMRQYERLAGIDPVASAEHGELYKIYLDLETHYVSDSDRKEAHARSLRNRAKFERANGDLNVAISLYEQSLKFIETGIASHQFLIPYAKALWLVGRVDDAMAQVQSVLDWSRQIGSPRSEAIAHQYMGLFLVERAQSQDDSDRSQAFKTALEELERALKLHEEVNFRQGYRETIVNLFELAVLQGDKANALKYLRMTDDYSGQSKSADEHQMCVAVLSQLRLNGEGHRADRIEAGLTQLEIGVHSATKP
jgi:tetratricopeptide (TPR) repeat protein